jgi:hypothetical protein
VRGGGPGSWGPIFVQLVEGLQSELGPPTPSPLASVSPLGSKGGGGEQDSLAGEGGGGPNSDDCLESLALCILCGTVEDIRVGVCAVQVQYILVGAWMWC